MAKGFLGLNPTAIGILTGGIVAGPAGLAFGGAIGGIYDHMQGMKRDAMSAFKAQTKQGIMNQNRLVEENYNKKLSARGLGEVAQAAAPAGGAASLEGGILTQSPGASNGFQAKNNILG